MRARIAMVIVGMIVALTAGSPEAVATTAASADSIGAFAHWAQSLPDYASTSGGTLHLSGTVVNAGGKPVLGATVVLVAEPSNAVLHNLAIGRSVALRPLARTRTKSNGTYTLGVPAGTVVTGLVDSAGAINAAIISSTGAATGVSYVSGAIATRTADAQRLAADDTAVTVATPITLHATPARAATPDSGGPPSCIQTTIADLGPRPAVIGETFSKTSHVTSTFTYSAGQSSSLGVGIDYSLSGGSFSVSGTHSVSSSSSTGYPTQAGARNIRYFSSFQYKEFGASCGATSWRSVEAVDWDGGASIASIGVLNATYCRSYIAGSTFTKTSSTATEFQTGVSMSTVIGINLSSQTGYSHTAAIEIHMNAAATLCGYHGYPSASSPAPGLISAQ